MDDIAIRAHSQKLLDPQYKYGIYLKKIDLWIDASKPKAFAICSHAHADHVSQHANILATPETAALIRCRFGTHYAKSYLELPYGCWHHRGDYAISLHPAGHVLGSSMVLIEHKKERWLYTGDFKFRENRCCEAINIPQADYLIMETTFGLPKFRFPNNAQIASQIHQFCDQAFRSKKTPILLAYSLGKAQEALAYLKTRSEPIYLHPSIAKVNQVYRQCGYELPTTQNIESVDDTPGILLMPPAAYKAVKRPKAYTTALLSGWGIEASAPYRRKVDTVIPLSDHADYPDLLELVARVAPKKIYTTHGYQQEFAASLRRMGYDAWSLKGEDQLELSL